MLCIAVFTPARPARRLSRQATISEPNCNLILSPHRRPIRPESSALTLARRILPIHRSAFQSHPYALRLLSPSALVVDGHRICYRSLIQKPLPRLAVRGLLWAGPASFFPRPVIRLVGDQDAACYCSFEFNVRCRHRLPINSGNLAVFSISRCRLPTVLIYN